MGKQFEKEEIHVYILVFPRWLSWYIIRQQCRRLGLDPWVRKIPCRRKWQPTPVFLPGEFQGQRSLGGYVHEVVKESDKT